MVVFPGEAEVLEDRLVRALEEVAAKEMVLLAHPRAGDRVHPGHERAGLLVRSGRGAQRGGVPRIAGDLLGLRLAEPPVVRSATLEVAGGPDPVREVVRTLHLR